MIVSELNIGDTFTIAEGNYMKIDSNTDNFKITHLDKYFDISNYSFVLNLDTATLGILLNIQEVTVCQI
jgi:hypothetical protein